MTTNSRLPAAPDQGEAERTFDAIWERELDGVQYWIARVRRTVASILRGGNPDATRAELLHLVDLGRGLEADLGRMLAWEALPASQALLTQSTFVISWAGSLLESARDSFDVGVVHHATQAGLPDDALEAADVLSDATASAKQLAARLSNALRESDRASRET